MPDSAPLGSPLADLLDSDRFAADERAIEGLPVRLVVAFVVGVATLSVLLSMVSGVNTLAVSELDAKPSPDVVTPGDQTLSVTAVDPEGNPVSGATVVVKAGTADLDGVATATTDDTGTATLKIDPQLGPNQAEGDLILSLKPPAGSDYVDRRGNTAVLVVRD
jgi:hypothetical protein